MKRIAHLVMLLLVVPFSLQAQTSNQQKAAAPDNETIYGQKIITEYHATETYVKRDGRWQMLASHVMVVPSERKSIALDPKSLDAFTGLPS